MADYVKGVEYSSSLIYKANKHKIKILNISNIYQNIILLSDIFSQPTVTCKLNN